MGDLVGRDEYGARYTEVTEVRLRAFRQSRTIYHRPPGQHTRVIITWVTAAVTLLAVIGGTLLYATGEWNPFARVTTLAELPAPVTGGAYTHLAMDHSGVLWVAQSSPGLAAQPKDATVLTVVDPSLVTRQRILARLCLGCAGVMPATTSDATPALARIDAIAPDPRAPHAVYVAGWSAASPSVPIVVHVAWRAGVASCSAKSRCATESVTLSSQTAVAFLGTPVDPTTPLLTQLLGIGVAPLLTVTTAPNGDLYCFISDRGQDGLGDTQFNVTGGFQGLLEYAPASHAWREAYVGPAGTRPMQRLSPTSSISSIVVDRAERYLYLADVDHQAIYRVDLHNSALGSGDPFIAAGTVARVAGQAVPAGAFGDVAQAIPGWIGDGGRATAARLNGPRDLALDAAGDLLIADTGNGRIRLLTPQGTLWTVAGNGANAEIGDDGAPLQAGMGGAVGLAIGPDGTLFITPGATLDGGGHVRLRAARWGWRAPRDLVGRETIGGTAWPAQDAAGLAPGNNHLITASVISATGCATAAGGCVQPVTIMAGGTLPDQSPLALPQATGAPVSIASTPVVATSFPGVPIAVTAGTALAFTPEFAGCCATTAIPAMALPSGMDATGIALLAPVTQSQVARLGAAYILVAAEGGAIGPALLIYRAAPETCATLTAPANGCTHFPGSVALVAIAPFTNQSGTGAIGAALSDDGAHAFAIVAHPTGDQVSVVDLSPLTRGGAPSLRGRLAILSPQGSIAIRHDGLATYIGAGNGQIAAIDTAGWLSQGVPSPLPPSLVSVVAAGDATTATTALVQSGDDSRLFAAFTDAAGAITLGDFDTGGFGTPIAPRRLTTWPAPPRTVALALAADDTRLFALAPGQMQEWLAMDPANPTAWLAAPQPLGSVAVAAPVALVGG